MFLEVVTWRKSSFNGDTKKGISGASTIKHYRFVMHGKGIDGVVS